MSRAISIMERKGLVKKEGVGNNFYRALLKLTDEGNAVAEQISERAMVAVEFGGKGLTDEQRDIFYEALERIASNLQSLSREGLPLK